MSPVLPAVLAAAGIAVAVGMPLPARRAVLAPSHRSTPRLAGRAVAVAVAAVLLVGLGAVAGALGGALTLVAQRAFRARALARARTAERAAATESLAVLAAELRAGRVPADALAAAADVAVGPTQRALSAAAAATRFGAGPDEGLLRSADACAAADMMRGLAACWQVCAGTGSSLATAVDRLEEGLRGASRQRDLVETEVAQARASALVLACFPAGGLLLAFGLGADPLHVLLHTPVGAACLVAGVTLDVIGFWWARRLVARAADDA